jgi:hypothetical protein
MHGKSKVKTRSLKVGEGTQLRGNIFGRIKFVPKIVIAGDWLLNAGFPIGCQTKLTVFKNQIVIEKI